jgi:hypothetical protein
MVLDENCHARALQSNGGILAADSNGIARMTDGSSDEGLIQLNPEEAPALTTLMGSDERGNLFSMGKEAKEGSLIIKKGGKWVVSTIDTAKKVFDQSQLRKGSGSIAAFICGSEGNVELGLLSGCINSYIYLGAEGEQECHNIQTLTTNIQKQLCDNAPNLPAGTSASHFLTCEGGVIYKSPITPAVEQTVIKHVTPWYDIGTAGLNIAPGEQPLFNFTPSLLPGYEAKYKTVWLWASLIASSHGADYRIDIRVGGQQVIYGMSREHPNTTGDFINPTLVFPFPITAPNSPIMTTKNIWVVDNNTGQIFEMEFRLRLVGWST